MSAQQSSVTERRVCMQSVSKIIPGPPPKKSINYINTPPDIFPTRPGVGRSQKKIAKKNLNFNNEI